METLTPGYTDYKIEMRRWDRRRRVKRYACAAVASVCAVLIVVLIWS